MADFGENQLITKEWVDAFVSEHGRTSCNDDDPANGYQNDNGYVRCLRCCLLNHIGDKFGDLPVELSIEQHPRYEEAAIKRPIIK